MSDPPSNRSRIERRLAAAVIVNFIAFGVISVFIGGDAINGHIDGTTHILSAHGTDTIVAPWVWTYSLIHARLTIISFLGMFIYVLVKRLFGLATPKSA